MADNNNTRRRVKLYMLNEDRVWDDRGTGHVSSAYVEKLRGMSLLVRSENDGTLLLESKILPDTAYQKQQETLIVWSEAENYDLALSFQERAGCDEIWEKICQVQGKDPSVDITQDVIEESEDDRFEDIPDAAPPIELPSCDLSKLEEISELFSSVLPSLIRREKLSLAIESEGYIKKLLDVFHMCEDLENLEGLHHLYDIFKSIFMLNKNALFDIMFTEDTIFDVVGVLEYDPALTEPAKHREFLRNTAQFKEVVPLNNSDLVQKIHQTFRVQYIQDVILPTPSVFEENTFSTLNSFIFFNKVEIVGLLQEDVQFLYKLFAQVIDDATDGSDREHLVLFVKEYKALSTITDKARNRNCEMMCCIFQDDEKFLYTLFAQLVDDETDDRKRRDLVFFLKEFCTFSQTLQAQSRDSFFKTLSNMGVLGALETILGLDDNQMKSAAVDIFSYIVEFSPSMVREFIVQEGQKQDDEDLLINLVIEQMISDTDPEMGGAVQLMGILRVLIDPDNMQVTANKTEITEFLGFFYKHSMHILTAPLFANTSEDRPSKDDYQTAQLLSLILELLTFCIEHHTYHIKNYVLNKDLLRRVLVLLKSEHAFLALGALRLMRKLIGPKDEFYNRYIIRGDLFKPVVEAFLGNGNRYNLLNSAMIEIFEFIRVDDIKSLTAHIVENHWNSLQHITYVQTFRNLKLRYEQQQDRARDRSALDSVPSILRNNRFNRRDGNRTLDDDEELWFEQDDDIGESEEIMPMSDMLKTDMLKSSKIDEFDAFSMKYESKKAAEKENEAKEAAPKFINRTANTISFNINRSPPQSNNSPITTPTCSPANSPVNSPVTAGTKAPYSSPNKSPTVVEVQTKKPGLVGLVDYDNDSDEEEQEDDSPSVKRARTTVDS